MSLISEALKRAEQQQATQSSGPSHNGLTPQPPKRRFPWRTLILGFLFVSLGTSTASLFFAAKLADDPDPTTNPNTAPDPAPKTLKTEPPDPDPPPQNPETPPEPTPQPIPDPPDKPAPQPSQTPPSRQTSPESPPDPSPMEPQPPEPSEPPPFTERVKAFQVRAVVSGGTRILLHDPKANKTEPLSTGQRLPWLPDLTLQSIKDNALIFTDHDGFQYTLFF